MLPIRFALRSGFPLAVIWLVLSQAATAEGLFEVGATGAGLGCSAPGAPGTISSETPGIVIDASQAVGDFQYRNWFAQANAHSLGVRAGADSYQGGTGCIGSRSYALFSYDDLVFGHDTLEFISLSIDIHYEGLLRAEKVQGEGGQVVVASVRNEATLDSNGGTNAVGLFSGNPALAQVSCGSGCSVGDPQELVYDEILTHAWVDIPTNTPVTLEVGMLAEALVSPNFSQGGRAETDFADSLTLANPTAVFNLPEGVTANSTQMGLRNNTLQNVPEPSTLVLLGVGLVGLLGSARRSRGGRLEFLARAQRHGPRKRRIIDPAP